MPRPLRSRKVAAQKGSSATPPITTKPTAAHATTTAVNPSSDLYDVSDREKERQNKRVEARRTLLEMNPEQVNALEDSRRKRDAAMDKLANISSTTKENTTTDDNSGGSGAAAEEDLDSPAIELSRREDAPSTRPPRHTDVSGLDLDDSTFGNLEDSLDDSQNAIEDTRSGYRSTDTSSFNINLFKRRPRQSSIVGRDDAPIRPSSRGQNTPSISSHLNLGRFKRRAREPSILSTAQKDRSTRPPSRATSVTSRTGNLTADEDSGPDDESTPLNLAKRRSGAAPTGADMTIEMSPTLPTRKRKSGDNLESGSAKRPALGQGEEGEEEEIIHQSIEADNQSIIPSTPPNRSIHDRFSTPVIDPNDPDMAPPASSDSADGGSPVVWPSLDALAHRNYNQTRRGAASREAQKTPELEADDDSSILSSPPSLTHSPNYNTRPTKAAPPKKKPAPAPKVTTTADLTSLLPRRRTKQKSGRNKNSKDPFDLDDSSVEDEQGSENEDGEGDELSVYVDPRRRKQAGSKSASKGKGKAPAGNKGKGKEVERAGTGDKNKDKRKLRTYGSRAEEEEEDVEEAEIVVGEGAGGVDDAEDDGEEEQEQEVDPETSQMMLERLGEELQQAAKKFKEVDRWELSFEEVEESSSPVPDGR